MKLNDSDEQLMLLYVAGNVAAFERLYQKHKGALYRFCLRQLRRKVRAEECFQEVWIKLINSRENYQPSALFTTYLYRIAQNHVIDILRKDKKLLQETELDEEVDYYDMAQSDMVEELIAEDKVKKLRLAIESLPAEQKTAMLLKVDAGMSLEAIGDVLNCGRETVKSRLRYATAKLKVCLETNDETC